MIRRRRESLFVLSVRAAWMCRLLFAGGRCAGLGCRAQKTQIYSACAGSSRLTFESFCETGHSSGLNISQLSCLGLPFLLSSTYFARSACTPSFLILHVVQNSHLQTRPGARPTHCAAHAFREYPQFAALMILNDLFVKERTQVCIKRPRHSAKPNKSTKDS